MEQVLEDSSVFISQADLPLARETASKPFNMHHNELLMEALRQHESSFLISDPQLPDHPIVYASEGFCVMSGFSTDELVGHTCRFLEGPDTDIRTILEIRDAIRDERPCRVRMLNYTKHGKALWNLLHLAPLYSRADGRVVLYVGMYTPTVISLSDMAERFSDSLGVTCPKLRDMAVSLFNGPLMILMDTAARSLGSTDRTEAQDLSCETEADTDLKTKATEIAATWSAEVEDSGTNLHKSQDVDNQKARVAVMSVIAELTRHSGGNVTDRRAMGNSVLGIVCSSLVSLNRIKHSFVLVDPHLPDMPIVHASEFFLQLTGYTKAEVLGRNCRFLQGPGTDTDSIRQIRDALSGMRSCTVWLLNYKKDGQPFWNWLHMSPVRDCGGKVAYYAGVQVDCADTDLDVGQIKSLSAHRRHLGALAAIRVAVRGAGLQRVQCL
uniref:Putative LOV domain-containing protein n=1 Tax=Phaeoceros carolinianus TaxID=185665 RepID=A0A126X379_9EMBR|nr:putative LOV domain-containing protein [Phaeoceros carolinianus]